MESYVTLMQLAIASLVLGATVYRGLLEHYFIAHWFIAGACVWLGAVFKLLYYGL